MTQGPTVLLCSALLLPLSVLAQSLAAAKADARLGRVDAALAELASSPKSAETHALQCALYGSIEKRDQAVGECEAASAAAPSSSEAALALARAYGDKADHSGVQLDPGSVEALSDLGQFYVEAPGVVGGGLDKARTLIAKLQPLSAARAHRLAGMIAVKAKDEKTAEAEFNAELSAGQTPEAYVDLANFYRNHKQPDRAAEEARLALTHDTHHGPDSLDAAAMLLELKHDTKAADDALRAYLKTPQNGVASYARAHVLLGNRLRSEGDTKGAQQEFSAALALAHDYEPARRGAGE